MGYRIQIENTGCLNCGVCMDVCPVQALDMSRPQRPGVEGAGVFGTPFNWMMEYPVQVGECIGCGICVRECPTHVVLLDSVAGATPLAARQGPISRPAEPTPAWQPLSEVTRESLKPARVSPWGKLFQWRDERAAAGLAGLAIDGHRLPPRSHRPVPGSLPRRNGRRAVCRADRPGPLRRGLRGRGRGQPIPVGVRLDLHRPVRVGLPARHAGRADRHSASQALCRRGGQAAAGRPPKNKRKEKVAIVGGGPGRHVGRLLPGSARLRRDRPRGDARAGRHDGHRHPRVPAAARGHPRGDRPDRRPGRRAEARQRHGPRLHPGRSRSPSTTPSSWPRARPAAASSACPATTCRVSSRPRSSSSRSTSARSPSCQGFGRRRRWRQHGHGRGPVRAPVRCFVGHDPLPPRSSRDAGPGRRGRGGRARRHQDPVRGGRDRGQGRRKGVDLGHLHRPAADRQVRRRASRLRADPRQRSRHRRRDGPGGRRRGAGSVDPPGRRRHRDERLLRHRGRRRPGHRPQGRLRRWRRRVGRQDDHPRRRGGPPRRRFDPRIPLRQQATARPRSWPRSECRRPRAGPDRGSGRAAASRDGAAGYKPGSFAATQPSLDPPRQRRRRRAASGATPSTAARRSTSSPGAGRDRPAVGPSPMQPAPARSGRPNLAESASTPPSITGGRD
jgi:ferredoxin